MTNKKIYITAFILLAFMPFTAKAMHISEGFLPPAWCALYFAISIPFFIRGLIVINKRTSKNKDLKMLLALVAAFCFVLSAVKLPSVAGSSSHPTGTGLGAILFGPSVMAVIGAIVLLMQVFFMAHGGITTLGANVFSMAVAGPMMSYIIYALLKKRNRKLAIFLASALGNLTTYVVTSIQLALAFPSPQGGVITSFLKFASIFAISQVPLAIVEGLITTAAFSFIEKLAGAEMKELREAKL